MCRAFVVHGGGSKPGRRFFSSTCRARSRSVDTVCIRVCPNRLRNRREPLLQSRPRFHLDLMVFYQNRLILTISTMSEDGYLNIELRGGVYQFKVVPLQAQGNQKGKSSLHYGKVLGEDGFRNVAKRSEILRNTPKYNRYRLCRP